MEVLPLVWLLPWSCLATPRRKKPTCDDPYLSGVVRVCVIQVPPHALLAVPAASMRGAEQCQRGHSFAISHQVAGLRPHGIHCGRSNVAVQHRQYRLAKDHVLVVVLPNRGDGSHRTAYILQGIHCVGGIFGAHARLSSSLVSKIAALATEPGLPANSTFQPSAVSAATAPSCQRCALSGLSTRTRLPTMGSAV